MIAYKNNGVSAVLIRKTTGKKSESKGECPIYWRVTYMRKAKYYFTGSKFSESDWMDLVERDLAKHRDTKKTWQRYFDNTLRKIIDDLVEKNEFSFDTFEQRLGKSDILNLNDAFRGKISQLMADDRVNYAESYSSTLSNLDRFKGSKISFQTITPDFLRRFEKYLIESGKSVTTVGFYMRNIRTVINSEKYLSGEKYPFGRGKYVIPKGERRELALELSQIHMIQAYKCGDPIKLYRDLWLFSFYGNGINMTDICRLKYDEIKNGEITFIRKKTKEKRRKVVRIFIPITTPLKKIIKEYGNKNKEGYIFPFLDGIQTEKQRVRKIADITKNVNEAIQLIAKDLKLPDNITTYATRHSYVTILERLHVPRVFIQNSLGHTDESVTDSYSKMAERELRFKYNTLLLPMGDGEIVKDLANRAKTEIILN